METYPNNTGCNFFNNVPPMTLTGDYELVVTKIMFDKTWHNFNEDVEIVYVYGKDTAEIERETGNFMDTNLPQHPAIFDLFRSRYVNSDQHHTFRYMGIPKTYFPDVKHIVDYINSTFQKISRDQPKLPLVHWDYDPVIDRVRIDRPVNGSVQVFTTNPYLFRILGFQRNQIVKILLNEEDKLYRLRNPSESAENPPSLDNISTIFVYCNIIVFNSTANTMHRLLMTVPVDNNLPRGSKICYEPKENVCRVQISTNFINEVHIQLADSHGNDINFSENNIVLECRIRRPRTGI
jgi:hypothetical protein